MSFLRNWCIEAGRLKRRQESAGRRAILEDNQRLRNEPEALRTLSFAQPSLNIPEPDLYALWRKYPDLNAKDKMTKRNAWLKFIASSESDPYRVRERRRSRAIAPNQTNHFEPAN